MKKMRETQTGLVGFRGIELELGKNAFDHRTVDIREPVITASKAVRELFMIKTEQVQNGGPKIIERAGILDRAIPKLIPSRRN